MKKVKLILHYLILFNIIACNKNSSIRLKKEITFDLNYNSNPNYRGVIYDEYLKKELVYFADPSTNKCIKFFDLNSNLIDSISLKQSLLVLNEIEGIIVYNRDTILLNAPYSNKMVYINRKGDVFKKIDLNKVVKDSLGNLYEFHPSYLTKPIKDYRNLILNCEWRSNYLDERTEIVPQKDFDYLKYYYKKCFKSPYFINILNTFDSLPKYNFGFNDFHKSICDSPSVCIEGANFLEVKNKIYLILEEKLFFKKTCVFNSSIFPELLLLLKS